MSGFGEFTQQLAGADSTKKSPYADDGFILSQLQAEYGDQVAKPQISFWDMLNGGYQKKQQEYIQALMDRKTNAEALASARAYENTAIQRQVADMKAAGLNPYWMTSGSSIQGAASSSESRNTYKPSGSSAKTGGDFMSLIKTLAVIAMVAMK